MSNIVSDKIVTTRKSHVCSACLRRFDAGTKMRAQVNTIGGQIGTWRECPTCIELLSKYRDKFADDDFYNICMEGCVNDYLENEKTLEDLLTELNNHGIS